MQINAIHLAARLWSRKSPHSLVGVRDAPNEPSTHFVFVARLTTDHRPGKEST